jgi:hypothetical protein
MSVIPLASKEKRMRTILSALRFGLAIVLLVAATCHHASAGIYRIYDPSEGIQTPEVSADGTIKPLPFRAFQDELARLIQIGSELPPTSPSREKYLEKAKELNLRLRTGAITTNERVDLSERLLRLRRYQDAIDVLTPVAATERQNFMVMANLAAAHQLAGWFDRAISYSEQIVWPPKWPGFTKDQLRFFKLAEKYQLKLFRLRYRESIRQGPTRKPSQELDNLFGDDKSPIRFVGASGQYEPGKIEPKDGDKLPAGALAIVQQLALWFPDDTRLLWLLGELYNAQGDVKSAYQLLDTCVYSRSYPATELKEHRQLLRSALDSMSTASTEADSGWLPDTRHLILVGGLAGVVVVLLVYLQVREIRRRRKGRAL